MNYKQYMIDGQPATGREIIKQAELLCEKFAKDWVKQTSVAANILRQHGHEVTDNPKWPETA